LAVCAAQQRAELARHDFWQLAGFLPDINGRGRKGFEAGPGLQVNVPIFHQNQGAIALANADVERLRRQYVNRCDLAALEVRQAYTQLLQARDTLAIWRDEIVPQASEASTAAQKALEEDGVSLLLVLETTRQLLTSQQRELEAKAQLRQAIAELERSVGRRLFPDAFAENTRVEELPGPRTEAEEQQP
jgi:outer membrane protein TolC